MKHLALQECKQQTDVKAKDPWRISMIRRERISVQITERITRVKEMGSQNPRKEEVWLVWRDF